MKVYLVHHAQAVGPDVDTRRPLSEAGRAHAAELAATAKASGVAPAAIWHSGKLRARETAEAFWRACSPFAEFSMMRGLRPDDPPEIIRDALQRESRDLMLVGHMPHLAALRELLTRQTADFPLHGMVVVETTDGGGMWVEEKK